jgi:hypothetical protein
MLCVVLIASPSFREFPLHPTPYEHDLLIVACTFWSLFYHSRWPQSKTLIEGSYLYVLSSPACALHVTVILCMCIACMSCLYQAEGGCLYVLQHQATSLS